MSEGFFMKYVINKTDGSPIDPEAEYLVLRIDNSAAGRWGARAFAVGIMDEMPELSKDIINRVHAYDMLAQDLVDQPVKVNPDQKKVNQILGALEKTGGYCPCVPKYTWCDDTLCPCANLRNTGECHCELFVR